MLDVFAAKSHTYMYELAQKCVEDILHTLHVLFLHVLEAQDTLLFRSPNLQACISLHKMFRHNKYLHEQTSKYEVHSDLQLVPENCF